MTPTELVAARIDLSDAEIVSELNALSVAKTDSQRWTWAGLALRFGSSTVGQIDEVLKATPGYDWIRLLLAGGGIDFSSDATQAALESLRGTLGDTVDALKTIGVRHVSLWSEAGEELDATVEQVAVIRDDFVARRDAGAYWSSVQNTIGLRIDAGDSVDEIKTILAGLL